MDDPGPEHPQERERLLELVASSVRGREREHHPTAESLYRFGDGRDLAS